MVATAASRSSGRTAARRGAWGISLALISIGMATGCSMRGTPFNTMVVRDGEKVYKFDTTSRTALGAVIRTEWRRSQSEEPPEERIIALVIADLRLAAESADPDDEQAAARLEALGIPAGPAPVTADRGLSTITSLPGCPLPSGYQIPAPYTISPGGVWVWHPRGDADRAAWSALAIARVFTDPEGDQMAELVWLGLTAIGLASAAALYALMRDGGKLAPASLTASER